MKHLSMVVIVMATLVGGCGKKSAADKEIAQMDEFADAMCKCTDQQCTMKVMDDMSKHLQTVATSTDTAPDEKGVKKLAEIQKRMQECAAKVEPKK